MVNDLFNSLNKYFTHIHNTGYFSQRNVNKLLAFSLIEELVQDCQGYLDSRDYLSINKALYCLYGSTCLIPYPNYYNPNTKRTMFIGSCSQLARRVEELEKLVEYYHGGDYKPDDPTEVTDTPTITVSYDESKYIIGVVGKGALRLFKDGIEQSIPLNVRRTSSSFTINVTATAQEEGKLVSKPATASITIQAKEVGPEPETTPTPSITYEKYDNYYIITASGEGEVALYLDGVLVDNPYTAYRFNKDRTITFTATAQGSGKSISEVQMLTITIEAAEQTPTPQEKTPTPNISFTSGDVSCTITATGSKNSVVSLFANGSSVSNPYQVSRTDQDQTITFTATAVETGKLPSDTAVRVITIPASSIDYTREVIVPLLTTGIIVPYNSSSSQTSSVDPNKEVIVPF